MAGLWARAEEWLQFSDEWDRCLRESPGIRWFKMKEAGGEPPFDGEFHGFTTTQRDNKVRKLAQIIDTFAFRALNITLDLTVLDKMYIPKPKGAKYWPLDKPYFWAFHQFILAACLELNDVGAKGQCEIMFDEYGQWGERVKRWYPALRLSIPASVRHLAPKEPVFKDDKKILPLQAADMLAWLQRRNASGIPHSFGWLLDVFTSLRYSPYSIMPGRASQDSGVWPPPPTPEELAEYLVELKKLDDFHYGRDDE